MMSGCGAGLAGSSSQALAKGKQSDFDSVAAKNSKNFANGETLADASWSNWSQGHSFDSRKGRMIPGKDFDGYLKFPDLSNAHSRPKGFSYYLFGGTKSNWSVDTAYHNTPLYKYSNKDKGKIGIYYKNAAYYYTKDMKKPKVVSLRLTITNWTNPTWTWSPTNGSLNYFRFHPHTIGINARGDGVVTFHVDIIGVKNAKIPLSFWDVDYGQHIRVPKLIEAYHRTPTKVVYEKDNWFGGAPGKVIGPKEALNGTVLSKDAKGMFTVKVNSSDLDFSYGRNSHEFEGTHFAKSKQHPYTVEPGATIGKVSDIKTKVKIGNFGNWIRINSNKNVPWTPGNPVSGGEHGYHLVGKYAGLNAKGTTVGKDWVKNLKVPKPHGSFYYNIRNTVYWEPAEDLENFGIADNDFDPGLDIGQVKVYKQSHNGGKMFDRTNFFNISQGPHSVKVLAKPGALKQGRFYNGIYNVVIKATPNSKFNYDRKQGDKFVGSVHNQAQYVVQPTPGKLTWTGKTNKVTVTVTGGRKPKHEPIPDSPGRGAKWVYKRREGTAGKNSWDMSNYDNGTVVAGQELHYRLAFRIKALQDTDDEHKKYTEATITDHLPSELDGSTVKHAKISFNSPEGGEDISGDQTIKADASQFLSQMNDGGGVLYLNFDVRVKDNVKGGTVITNTGHAKIKADHQIKRYEDSYDATTKSWYTSSWWSSWESYKSWNPSTNTTRNPVGDELIPKPTKVGYALDRNFKNPQDLNYIRHDENFEYVITQRVPTLADDLGEAYKSFKMSDALPKGFNLHSVNIYIKEGDNKFRDASQYGDLVKGQTVIFKGDTDKMPLKGETYALVIKGSYDAGDEQIKPGQTVTNTATTHIDSPSGSFDLDSEPVNTEVEAIPSSIDKSIDNIHDDYKNTDIDPGIGVMNPKDEHTVSYRIQADIGNEHSDSFSLIDNMPEHVHLDTSSIKQRIDKDIGYGEYQEGKVEPVTGSSTDSKLDLNESGHKYCHITVTFKAKVDRESDWSDYYNANNGQMVYNNGTTTVTAQSYMKIPNIADLKFSDNTDVAMIPFNMGVQMFRTKQYIAQDDDKWSENLDPSHYNPVSKAKVRNNRSAVTTAIMLQMPNYMKLNQVKIMNTYKTPGFDKGWSSIRRANNKLIHDIENDNVNDLTNYDLGSDAKLDRSDSPDDKTWTDSTWHEPDNNAPAKTSRFNCPKAESYTDIQNTADDYDKDAAGRTYFFEQKWNPKTRYYHDYAQLGNMRTGFKATVYLKAESLGNRQSEDIESSDATLGKESIDHTWSNKDELNDVGIHLSNIYGYTLLEDKATYSQDGKTLKYKTYGQFLGLAVDKNNKTVFKDPGKSWTKPDMDVNGNNPTGGYNDTVGGYDGHAMNPEEQPVETWIGDNVNVLRLDSNVGTGDERVIENTAASPAKNVTKDYPSADKSDAATYDKTGHGTKKDDNSQFNKLDIMQFWTKAPHDIKDSKDKIIYYQGELMPKPLSHGYASGSDLTQTKGHSVTITIPRVKDDETLTTTRKDNISYEPYKKYNITKQQGQDDNQTKPTIDGQGFRTVDINVNQTATNPVKFITYYDFNRNFGGKSVTRVLREAYEVAAADSISAKAGYGIKENNQLMTFTYGHDMARSHLLNDYRTNLSSKDKIFDDGYTKTANDEALNMDYEIIRDNDKINTTMQSARKVGDSTNVDVNFLVGGKKFVNPDDSKNSLYSLVRAREDWRPLLPNYRLTVMRYKFNDRILDNGKQAYALHDQDTQNGNGVEYRDYNSNIGGYNYSDSNVTKGGFRNYLKDWLRNDDYTLNLRTTTTNKGLPGTIGFGVGYATDINYDQNLTIYGRRIKDEINVQPTISGREAQYPKIFNRNDQNWLRHNDSGTLSQ